MVYFRIGAQGLEKKEVIDGHHNVDDDTGSHPHITIDQTGNLHAVYSDNRFLRLIYAKKMVGNDQWEISPVTALILNLCGFSLLATNLYFFFYTFLNYAKHSHRNFSLGPLDYLRKMKRLKILELWQTASHSISGKR